MKKMTLKNKLVSGAIAVSLIGSSSLVFANTNAGSQFTAWGQSQIDAAKAAIEAAIDGSRTSAQADITAKANSDRETAKTNINTAGTNEKADTASKINAKLQEHISSLQSALAVFMASIGGDFDSLVLAENGQTTSDLNSQYTTLSSNINTVLNAAKDSNVKDVTEQSLLVKGQATSDLIKEINRVKSELAATIASEKSTAQGEVDTHLAGEVSRINGQLDTLIGNLESNAKTAIEAAGKSVEDSAVANFDRVINLTATETPIIVDEQKLKWKAEKMFDGKIKFTVENSNEFDVVYRYWFKSLSGQEGGVSETPYAEGSAKPGTSTQIFDNIPFPIAGSGSMVIEYLNENGDFVYVKEIGLY